MEIASKGKHKVADLGSLKTNETKPDYLKEDRPFGIYPVDVQWVTQEQNVLCLGLKKHKRFDGSITTLQPHTHKMLVHCSQ